jgi:serine/threonine protein phosphatase PrpC
MSRSLGDKYAHKFGCSSEPEICSQSLLRCDKAIVLGSDGIFQYVSNEEISDIVYPFYEKYSRKNNDQLAQYAAKELMAEVERSWFLHNPSGVIDDCSVIVLFLKHHTH